MNFSQQNSCATERTCNSRYSYQYRVFKDDIKMSSEGHAKCACLSREKLAA